MKDMLRDREQQEWTGESLTSIGQHFDMILDHMPVLVALLDPQFDFVRVNRAYAEADERDPSFFPGRNHFDLYPSAENEAIFRRVVATGEPYHAHARSFEYAEHPERGVTYWDWSLVPIKDPRGAVTSLVLTLANAASRVEAQKALRESEKRYRDLVENISDVIYIVDTRGTITYISPAIEALTGYSPTQVAERPFTQFIAPEDQERVAGNFQQVLAGESLGPNEYRVVTASGEVRWMRVSSRPIVDGDRVTGLQGVLTDITEHKLTRDQVMEAAVAEERSRLARELHDAATQTIFAASLIAETLPLVWERYPEEGQRGLEELRQLTQGALAEMRTLLLELRPHTLAEQELDVLIRQLADAMRARTRMPVTTTVVGECVLPFEVKIALYRIAQEALNNIAKHARGSWARVYLYGEVGRTMLQISDDGRGFDPADTGPHQLGLSIMRERAQAIGAEFTLKSRPGRGTEIAVTWQDVDETNGESRLQGMNHERRER